VIQKANKLITKKKKNKEKLRFIESKSSALFIFGQSKLVMILYKKIKKKKKGGEEEERIEGKKSEGKREFLFTMTSHDDYAYSFLSLSLLLFSLSITTTITKITTKKGVKMNQSVSCM
jgi:hypothetical protein